METETAEKINIIRLMREFPGLSYEYFANLDPFLTADLLGYIDGESKIVEHRRQVQANKSKSKRGR